MLLDEITSDINILNEKCVVYGSNLNIQIQEEITDHQVPISNVQIQIVMGVQRKKLE